MSPLLVVVLLGMNAALLAAILIVLLVVHRDSQRMADLATKTQQIVREMEEHVERDAAVSDAERKN